jgi:hypothetical protein
MADRVTELVKAYERQARMPWRSGLSGPERVWMAIYPPEIERRVRANLPEFEMATQASGHMWVPHDLTTAFSTWMAAHPRREAYFKEPSLLTPALSQFMAIVEQDVRATLSGPPADDNAVVALIGVGTLFPMIRVSDLIQRVAGDIRGRLLVLFPGRFDDGNYRLLDARDGWNYLAVPISTSEGGDR